MHMTLWGWAEMLRLPNLGEGSHYLPGSQRWWPRSATSELRAQCSVNSSPIRLDVSPSRQLLVPS